MPAIMTSRQSAELDHALERNGWTAEDVKKLSKGDRLNLVLEWLHGRAKIVPVEVPLAPYTSRIFKDEKLMLDVLDGTRTIAESKDVFRAGIDPDFKNRGLDKKSNPTAEMPVEIHEMVKDGMFAQIFGGFFGVSPDDMKYHEFVEWYREDLRKLCMKSDDQIINFCEKFPEKLRKDGFGTFFLMEKEYTENYVVVNVRVCSNGRLHVNVYKLGDDRRWPATGYRFWFIIPQLTETE